ncbi:hypothetical protein JA9_004616 [Meyerozyma sp. JA9]|nr:hypothetical protein JA9_004616 [Meyerozyma sp. JA9]
MTSRALSQFENFYRCRTANGFYKNFQVTASYSQDISLELLYTALRKTVLDYPILVCNIFRAQDCCIYRPIEHAWFRDVVVEEDEDKYLANGIITEDYMKMINEISFSLYTETPLFKVVVVGKRHLTVVLEHTIADGLVGNYFHEILVENLALVDDAKNAQVLKTNYGVGPIADVWQSSIFDAEKDEPKNPLPPPVDPFMEPAYLDYTYGDKQFFDQVVPEGFSKKWDGKVVASREAKLCFKLIHFDPPQTKLILAACKKNGVTVTSYLTIALAVTLSPLTDQTCYTTHKVATALRRHITLENSLPMYKSFFKDPTYKILGSSAIGYGLNLPPLDSFRWELVKQANKSIAQGASNRRGLNTSYGFFKTASMVDDNRSFFESGLGKPKADTVKVSNLGLVKTPEHFAGEKSWSIRDLYFSQDVSPSAAEFQLNAISTKEGLNLVFSYFAEIEGLDAQLQKNILEFANI